MKQTIDTTIIDNKHELSYIVDFIGKLLFKDMWASFKPTQVLEGKISSKGLAIIDTINNCFSKIEERNELINYLFTVSLNKLVE